MFFFFYFFFFQAEDGIRDLYVTGVQTCALPISISWVASSRVALRARSGSSSPRPREMSTHGVAVERRPFWVRAKASRSSVCTNEAAEWVTLSRRMLALFIAAGAPTRRTGKTLTSVRSTEIGLMTRTWMFNPMIDMLG